MTNEAWRDHARPDHGATLGEPDYGLIELLFFAYRDFVADADRRLAEGRLRSRAPSRAVFRVASARPDRRRAVGHPQDHQAEPQPRAQGPARARLRDQQQRRRGSPPAPAARHAVRRRARGGRWRGSRAAGSIGHWRPPGHRGSRPSISSPAWFRTTGCLMTCRHESISATRSILMSPATTYPSDPHRAAGSSGVSL